MEREDMAKKCECKKLEIRIKELENNLDAFLIMNETQRMKNKDIVQLAELVAQNSQLSVSQVIDISNWR